MEEIEVPTEHLQEELHHHAEHAGANAQWISRVALSSALFAGLAAVGALLSGHHANEAMLEQLHASDHWAQYQAKSIKSTILQTRISVLEAMGKPAPAEDAEKAKEYAHEQKEISEEAKKEELLSAHHLASHQIYARSVTFSQIAIAIGAIAVLTRRRRYWSVALASGVVGIAFVIQGILS